MSERDYISTRAAEELQAELTAAQARVAELEQQVAELEAIPVTVNLLDESTHLHNRIEELEEQRAQSDSVLRSVRAYGMLPERYIDEINKVLSE